MKKQLIAITLILGISTSFISCSAVSDTLKKVSETVKTETPKQGETTKPSETPKPVATASVNVDYKTAVEEFKKEFEIEGKTPKGAVKMYFKALSKVPTDIKLAEYLLTVVMNATELYKDDISPTGYNTGSTTQGLLKTQLLAYPNILLSYFGGTPEKEYKDGVLGDVSKINFPPNETIVGGIKVDNTAEKEGSESGRIYVKSGGKDLPTPIYMKKNPAGLWKLSNDVSSVATGVKKPTPTDF